MFKGQAALIAPVATAIFIAVFVLVGTMIYGYTANVTPHDRVINNETICTTCVNGTSYTFDNTPILNDTTLICYNASANLLTNGISDGTCLTYNIFSSTLNLTNSSNVDACQISDLVCTYTYDWATDDQQSFWNNTTTTSYSGFILAAVIVIVLAAVAIMGYVLLIKG